ncbi:RNA recognition motif domain-containing protein [Dioscorea alata]|uniref:RNA recognition motif domain-containing protein n=1 Tax=Dioscorea alata TaxID=55571 RepID=A0ACB7UPR1_DIOAL|nr:RNA recognition motif domain-containing protein [Dioscorea alata]
MRFRRWYCSLSSLPSPSKKVSKRSEVAKVKRTVAVKSFVQRYMLANPGVFPKPSEVRDAVGGSWYILKEILAEMKAEKLPASQVDQSTVTTSFFADGSDAKEVEGNMGSGTVNTDEGFGALTEMLNVAKSRTMEDKDPAVLASVKNSENFELLQPKKRQETMEDFTTSGSVSNQHLFCLTNQIVGEGKQNTVAKDTHRHSLKAKTLEDASSPCRIEGYRRRIGGMASSHYSLAPNQINSELDKTSPRNPVSLVELFTHRAEKTSFDCPNVNTLKRVTPVNFSEEGPYSMNQTVGAEENKQTAVTESEEASVGISMAFIRQSLKRWLLNNQHTSRSQLEKKQANMPYEVTESEENQDSNCLKLETILLDKDEKAVDTSDGLKSLFISDESDSDISAFEYPSPEPNNEALSSMKGFHLNINRHNEKLDHNNRLLVYFLPKIAKVKDLIQAFGDSGPISEICILPSRENRFNYAQVFFKTKEGLRKALSKTDVAVGGADVAMEAAITPSEICDRMFCTEPVNNTDFPGRFPKHPSRTVILDGLSGDLSFYDLKCALSTWGRITNMAMVSSYLTVFVEFESEKLKERALTKATISISGTTLSILRVDAPRTTIIRISNVNPASGATKVHSICESYGKVKKVTGRYIDTFDIHFKLSEWPNMLKIINRLNGRVVDQHKWTAQPATLIPAEVLQALWNKPEGQKQVHELVRNICERINDESESIDTSSLLSLAEEYSSS